MCGVPVGTLEQQQELAELLDMSNLDDVYRLFKLKEKFRRPLSKKEAQNKQKINARRCVYEKDNFIKVSQLREILQEGFDAIHKRFDKTDEMCRKNTIETDAAISKITQVTMHA